MNHSKQFRKLEASRQAVKIDVQIIATAITLGTDLIVTHDIGDYSKIAAGRNVRIEEVPDVAEQSRLPFDAAEEAPPE